MAQIETAADIEEGLAYLFCADPRLVSVADKAGPVPLRRTAPGFASLVRIIIAQQVSVASASAIQARVENGLGRIEAGAVLACDEDRLRSFGLSRPKLRTVRAAAEAVAAGLDLDGLCLLGRDGAHEKLTAISGIGPWTADIYLLFAAGHRDVLPAGDLALQQAVMDAFGLTERPSAKALGMIAEIWSPWRAVAARLLWAYYAAIKARDPGAVV